jgi:hypothetical protein
MNLSHYIVVCERLVRATILFLTFIITSVALIYFMLTIHYDVRDFSYEGSHVECSGKEGGGI